MKTLTKYFKAHRMLLSAAFCGLLFSCGVETPVAPDYCINRDTLINVMVDAQINESLSLIQGYSGKPHQELQDVLSEQIYKKYNISKSRLDTTISWYSAHPAQFSDLYNDILSELTKRKSALK